MDNDMGEKGFCVVKKMCRLCCANPEWPRLSLVAAGRASSLNI
jgi:hypothetical protein